MTMVMERQTVPAGVLFDEGLEPGHERGYYRMVVVREEPGVDAQGRKGLRQFKDKRYCSFPAPGMNDKAIEDMKRNAAGEGLDFYDPRPCPGCDDGTLVGWLRFGRKPEHNHTINYGVLAEEPESDFIVTDEAAPASASKGGRA